MLQSQKQNFLKSLNEAKKLPESHISELELELGKCRTALEQERISSSSAREEFRRSCRELQGENSHLKDQLIQVSRSSGGCFFKFF